MIAYKVFKRRGLMLQSYYNHPCVTYPFDVWTEGKHGSGLFVFDSIEKLRESAEWIISCEYDEAWIVEVDRLETVAVQYVEKLENLVEFWETRELNGGPDRVCQVCFKLKPVRRLLRLEIYESA